MPFVGDEPIEWEQRGYVTEEEGGTGQGQTVGYLLALLRARSMYRV